MFCNICLSCEITIVILSLLYLCTVLYILNKMLFTYVVNVFFLQQPDSARRGAPGWRHRDPHPQRQEGRGGRGSTGNMASWGRRGKEKQGFVSRAGQITARPSTLDRDPRCSPSPLPPPPHHHHQRFRIHTFFYLFLSVNFHSRSAEDGRPGGVHHQGGVPLQAPEQLRGGPRRQIHPQVPGGGRRHHRGESFGAEALQPGPASTEPAAWPPAGRHLWLSGSSWAHLTRWPWTHQHEDDPHSRSTSWKSTFPSATWLVSWRIEMSLCWSFSPCPPVALSRLASCHSTKTPLNNMYTRITSTLIDKHMYTIELLIMLTLRQLLIEASGRARPAGRRQISRPWWFNTVA